MAPVQNRAEQTDKYDQKRNPEKQITITLLTILETLTVLKGQTTRYKKILNDLRDLASQYHHQ